MIFPSRHDQELRRDHRRQSRRFARTGVPVCRDDRRGAPASQGTRRGVRVTIRTEMSQQRGNLDLPAEGRSLEPFDSVTKVRFEHSKDFPAVLNHLGVSLLISTYQAGKVLSLSAESSPAGPKLRITFHNFDQPMGMAIGDRSLAIGTRRAVWFLAATHELAPRIEPAGRYDAAYITRSAAFHRLDPLPRFGVVQRRTSRRQHALQLLVFAGFAIQLRPALAATVYFNAGGGRSLPPQRPRHRRHSAARTSPFSAEPTPPAAARQQGQRRLHPRRARRQRDRARPIHAALATLARRQIVGSRFRPRAAFTSRRSNQWQGFDDRLRPRLYAWPVLRRALRLRRPLPHPRNQCLRRSTDRRKTRGAALRRRGDRMANRPHGRDIQTIERRRRDLRRPSPAAQEPARLRPASGC